MASFTVNVPDDSFQRVIDGFCAAQGYMDQVPNPEPRPEPDSETPWEAYVANPQSKEDFVVWQLAQFLARTVTQYEQTVATQAAAQAAIDAAEPLDLG